MRRRVFIGAIGGLAAAWPVTALALAPAGIRRIGFLATWAENDAEGATRLDALKLRLQELGWIDGKNLQINVQFGQNDGERIRRAAAELIAAGPDVLIATTSTTTSALVDLTRNEQIPIVAAILGDPLALGFTKDLSHPTENITGFTTFNDTLAAKRFEMLREIVPTMRAAALMWVPINPQQVLLEKQTKEAAHAVGIELLSLPIKTANDIPLVLASAHEQHASAIIVAADPLTTGANNREIIERCISLKLPAVHTFAYETKNGALMSYGIDIADNYRRTAEYVDSILRGAKIADLPFQQPTRLTLSINLKTARAIGIELPATLVARADEVVE